MSPSSISNPAQLNRLIRWLAAGVAVATIALGQSNAPGGAAASRPLFQAGAATSNITPPLGSLIIGGFEPRPSVHVHDELHVRCLALDDGTTRLVFAVADNLGVNREVFEEAKRLVRESTGIPPANMMMSATHTHSGPSARGASFLAFDQPLDKYQRFLAGRIADGVRRAINNLEPARIGWAAGQVPQHVFNRRWLLQEGKTAVNPFGGQDRAVMNPGRRTDLLRPAGPTNPEVYFISIQSASGRPIALLANYWLHYVGHVGPGHISADYFGAFCDRIEELLGGDRHDPPFVGILANGPCGDVNNIDAAGPAEPRRPPYEKIRLVADDVAREVMRVYPSVKYRDWAKLVAAQAELVLALRRPSPELVRWARDVLARPGTVSPVHRREAAYARRTLETQAWPESVSVPLQAFRIGELGIGAIPFETFAETGLEIKAQSPFADTFTIELANGSYGYLPTPRQHDLGGYESWLGTNRVEREASLKIVARVLELLEGLRRKPAGEK